MGSNAAAPTPTPPFKPPICPDGLGLIITELGCSHQGEPYTSGSMPGLPIVQPTTTATSASTVAVSAITNNTPKRHTSTNIASISSSSPTESTMSSTTAATIPAGSDISSMSSSPAVSSNYTSASLSSRSLNDTSTIVSTSMSTSSPAAFESSSSTQSYATPMTLQYATDGSGAGSSTAGAETFTGAQSSATSSLAFSSKHSNHTGAIVGGVIGGLAFLLLATVATILLRRRMRIRHTAPSAEFMGLARGTTPGPGSGLVRNAGTMTPSGDRLLSLAPQRSFDDDDDDDRPPAFTPGVYADPVMEKVQVAAAMREQYRPRDSYFGGARADYKEGTSEIGHEGESTQVGTEEGYGPVGDEKSGYYTWAM